jgi:hypothetical protein
VFEVSVEPYANPCNHCLSFTVSNLWEGDRYNHQVKKGRRACPSSFLT